MTTQATTPASTDLSTARPEWLDGVWLILPTLLIVLGMMVVPLIGIVIVSFWTQTGFDINPDWNLDNYRVLFTAEGALYRILIVKSLWMSLIATIAVVVLAYPMAYFMAFRIEKSKLIWIILLTVPFWTSYLLRIFAWKVILGFNGVINSGLKFVGVIDKPLEFLLYNPTAVTITLAHAWAAYAVLPIYVSLEKIDRSLLEAATDLGDKPWERFWHITLPLSAPGSIATALMVFIPTVGDYVTPTLVGGSGGSMIGNSIQILFGRQNDAPLGSAVSVVMMALVAGVVCLFLWAVGYRKIRAREAI